jgi:hypothetical protein
LIEKNIFVGEIEKGKFEGEKLPVWGQRWSWKFE